MYKVKEGDYMFKKVVLFTAGLGVVTAAVLATIGIVRSKSGA